MQFITNHLPSIILVFILLIVLIPIVLNKHKQNKVDEICRKSDEEFLKQVFSKNVGKPLTFKERVYRNAAKNFNRKPRNKNDY